jgi:hypothetical protein
MMTLHQLEEAYFMFAMAKKIKKTLAKSQQWCFTIECFMPSYEPQNTSVCTRHSKMFKHDAFTFHPNDDLVMSLPFKFIKDLEVGKYTPLDKLWLKRLHANLEKIRTKLN